MKTVVEPGIYFGMPAAKYHAAEGLSCSGMKQLLVSPLNYWHRNLNPDYRHEEAIDAMKFGTAVHDLVLEPTEFSRRYATWPKESAFPNVLKTCDDMKTWLADRGLPTTSKRKQDLIDRIKGCGPGASFTIWDEVVEKTARENATKCLLSEVEFETVRNAAHRVTSDPSARGMLQDGAAEVSIFVRDPDTGVMLKSRLDYVNPRMTIDLKTFSNTRGKPTKRAIFDAIYYESYYLQAAVCDTVRAMAAEALEGGTIHWHDVEYRDTNEWRDLIRHDLQPGFAFIFVESSEPFDLHIVQAKREESSGVANVYWEAGQQKMRECIDLYARCMERHGDSPWREPSKPHVLNDSDLPQLMWEGRN